MRLVALLIRRWRCRSISGACGCGAFLIYTSLSKHVLMISYTHRKTRNDVLETGNGDKQGLKDIHTRVWPYSLSNL